MEAQLPVCTTLQDERDLLSGAPKETPSVAPLSNDQRRTDSLKDLAEMCQDFQFLAYPIPSDACEVKVC
jgi:hypothetical protein